MKLYSTFFFSYECFYYNHKQICYAFIAIILVSSITHTVNVYSFKLSYNNQIQHILWNKLNILEKNCRN